MKHTAILLVSLITLLVLIIACEWDGTILSNDPYTEQELGRSEFLPELATFTEVHDIITARFIETDPDLIQLQAALDEGDQRLAARLIGFDETEITDLNTKLEETRVSVESKYPEYFDYANEYQTEQCDYTTVLQNLDVYLQAYTESHEGSGVRAPGVGSCDYDVSCDWVQYMIGLALCVETGPIIYWFCGYLAMCASCSGGYVDDVCM